MKLVNNLYNTESVRDGSLQLYMCRCRSDGIVCERVDPKNCFSYLFLPRLLTVLKKCATALFTLPEVRSQWWELYWNLCLHTESRFSLQWPHKKGEIIMRHSPSYSVCHRANFATLHEFLSLCVEVAIGNWLYLLTERNVCNLHFYLSSHKTISA